MMQNDVVKQDVLPLTLGFWFESFPSELCWSVKMDFCFSSFVLRYFCWSLCRKMGENLAIINDLLLLKQGRHYKQRIYVHRNSHKIQLVKWIIRPKFVHFPYGPVSISAWFTDTLRLQNQRKNVPQFPFDHFSIRVHNKLLDKYTVKFLLSTWRLLFPPGKLVSVLYCSTQNLLSVSRQTN